MAMDRLCVLSLNVRGLRNNDKRAQVFSWIRKQHASIIMLQETYLTNDLIEKVNKEWKGKAVHNTGTNHSRGVSILFDPKLNNIELKEFKDDLGRKICVNCKIADKEYSFLNIYTPNVCGDRIIFLNELSRWLTDIGIHDTIIGGDWNTVLNLEMDKSPPVTHSPVYYRKAAEIIGNLCKNFQLYDVWRERYPRLKQFTWRRKNPETACRLDFFLIHQDLKQKVINAEIKAAIRTDHQAIMLTIALEHSI